MLHQSNQSKNQREDPTINCKKGQISQISQLELQLSISQSGRSRNQISGSPSPIKQQKRHVNNNRQKIQNIRLQVSNTRNLDQQQESNLLDSTIKQRKKQILTQSINLNKKTDEKLVQGDNVNSKQGKFQVSESSRQIILQTEIIDLQMRCTSLIGLIHNLRKQFNISLADIQNIENNLEGKLDSSSHEDSSFSLSCSNLQKTHRHSQITDSKDLNKQIQSFASLEKHVADYRAQLSSYQSSIRQIQKKYDYKVENLNITINGLKEQIFKKQKQIENERKCNREMVKKNEELLLEVERLSNMQVSPKKKSHENLAYFNQTKSQSPVSLSKEKKNMFYRQNSSPIQKDVQIMPFLNTFCKNYQSSPELDISINSKYGHMYRNLQTPSTNPQLKLQQYSFSLKQYQECIKQMQIIIEKLADGLKFQKKSKQILMIEISRLCAVVRQSEAEIKDKNNKIYALEKQIISSQIQTLKKQEISINPFTSKSRKSIQEGQRALSSHEIKSVRSSFAKDRYEKIPIKKMQENTSLKRHYSETDHMINARDQQRQNCFSDYYDYQQGMGSSKNLQRGEFNGSRRIQNAYKLNKPRPSNIACEDYVG